MKHTGKALLLIVLALALAAELGFIYLKHESVPTGGETVQQPSETAAPTETDAPAADPTETGTLPQPTEAEAPETEAPTEPPTEPEPESFLLTFTGDCTLGSTPEKWNVASSFVQTIGEDYDYPFRNVADYFQNDDFTMINLEGPLTDSGNASSKRFAFRGPTAYTAILTGSSVEAVTLANNHAEDYGKAGYKATGEALTEAGVAYVEKDKTALVTIESGLKIGLYAGSFDFSAGDIKASVSALRKAGAEVVICAFHWGGEGKYRPSASQEKFAHAAIDAGADIVYGHHPHVLQKIEHYKDGVIFYSLGNFSFGGAVFPQDYDSAFVQQEIIRDTDGKISLGELTIIPISISSMKGQNNYQPTPLEPGNVYDRIISKLDGSFNGPDLIVDYSKLDGNKPSEPGSSGNSGGSSSGGDSGASSGGENSGGSDAGASSGGSSAGGESGGGSPGGESGSSSGGAE